MSQIDYPPVREAMDTLRGISDDELKQLHALARKRALMDQAELVDEARTEGRAEGRAEGIKQSQLDTARMMLEDGEPVSKITRYTGLTKEEIETIR